MKLLYDQNLPPALVINLASAFPQSQHVFNLGLDRASDEQIRAFARDNNYMIVTKMRILVNSVSFSIFRQKSSGLDAAIVP